MNDDARVVVIGSGPCGAMAAATLVEAGISGTMLESGTQRPTGLLIRANGRTLFRSGLGLRDLTPFATAPDGHATLLHARSPGGLSSYWTGAVPRFAPQDFDDGGRLHERYIWPLGYTDLVTYYERVERIMDVSGTSTDVPAMPAPRVRYEARVPRAWQGAAARARTYGQDLVPVPLADGAPWMVARRATAFNSFDRIVAPLRARNTFHLALGAHAERLEWDGARGRVTAVSYVERATKQRRRIPADAVVVAAGPVESARLLLNSSSSDFPAGLGDVHGVLGRFVHDHPNDVSLVEFDRPVERLAHTLDLTRMPYVESAPLVAALATVGNARMTLTDRLLNLTPLHTRFFALIVFGTIVPIAENRITLHPERRDEFGVPLAMLDIRFDDDAIKNVICARERARAVLEGIVRSCHVRALVSEHHPGSSTHYGGSVRMHASPKHGMLDGWSRLHAVPNVLVADASAFTTGPEKNPTLTAMALAARAAEHLAAQLRSGA